MRRAEFHKTWSLLGFTNNNVQKTWLTQQKKLRVLNSAFSCISSEIQKVSLQNKNFHVI